jgi:hypothetical protein
MNGEFKKVGRREFEPTKWAIRENNVVEGVLLDSFTTKYGDAYKIRVTNEDCDFVFQAGGRDTAVPGDIVCVRGSAMTKDGLKAALDAQQPGTLVAVKVTFRGRTTLKNGNEATDADVEMFTFPPERYHEVTGLERPGEHGQTDIIPF